MAAWLFEAARAGNVETLLKLVEDDPGLLGAVALSGSNTPLHIACLAGHHDFVQELVKLRPQFARELNQDGLSPLHIASANGYVDMVKEILRVDSNLSLVKGRERRLPLHYAAVKGRVHVMEELISASFDSVAEVTARGETALHLAVKNNQFEAFRVLLENLKPHNKEIVLNKKNYQGNTVLHLAVAGKQFEVVDLMLNGHGHGGVVEVNSLNKGGVTPLDVLLLSESEAGDREFEQILRQAGAKQAQELQPSWAQQASAANLVIPALANPTNVYHHDHQSTAEQIRTFYKQVLDYLKYNRIRDSPMEVRNILLVVAILIATATYQAALSPPGGVWQDDSPASSGNSTASDASTGGPHTAGMTILGAKNCVSYCIFLFSNSVGFLTSLHMINILTVGFYLRYELLLSTAALLFTYYLSLVSIAPPHTGIAPIDLFMWVLILSPAATFLLLYLPRWKTDALPPARPATTQV